MSGEQLQSVAQAAKQAGVAEGTIRYWVRTGRLIPIGTIGKRTLVFRAADVERAALAERSVSSPLLDGKPKADEAAA